MHTQVHNTVKIRGETKNFVERMKENRKLKLEDRSQKKKIMFLHSKNKASRKGYKGEC